MGNGQPDATLPVDSRLGARLAGPALPFSGAAGGAGVACFVLDAPEGAAPLPIALGVFPWRLQGSLRLTVIVKASFSFAGDALEALPVGPEALRVSDLHHRNQPLTHVVAASDRVPWKTAVDVTLLGHACAPGGQPAPEVKARFALLHGAAAVIDKTVRVLGDRASRDAEPKPFTKIPIVYERTHGGMGTPSNPIGCSGDDDDLASVIDPENLWRPAGFGPISAAWPLRHKKLGDTPRRVLEGPIMELPPGFPFAYFQSAPQDQQLPALEPDATLVLEGFHAERARIQLALPGVRAVGAVYGLDEANPDAPSVLPFRLDTLHVDADEQVVTLGWRAFVFLRDEAQLGKMAVAAGAGPIGQEPALPGRRPEGSSSGSSSPVVLDVTPAGGAGTRETLDPSGPAPSARLPFARGGAHPLETTLVLPGEPIPVEVAAPPPEARSAAPLFHDLSKMRAEDGLVLRAKDEPPAPPPPPRPEEQVDLERHAQVCVVLAESGAVRAAVLEAAGLDAGVYRKAEMFWKDALLQETKRGEQALRNRFDEAYVRAWEARHPESFGLPGYARLRRAEEMGRVPAELEAQGLDSVLAMRLSRVWRRRIQADAAQRAELDRALAELRKP